MGMKMSRKTILSLILIFGITLFVLSKPSTAQVTRTTVFIQSDGSVSPANLPIERNGDLYTFTADIYDPILIQKSNIILDGAGYSLIGPLTETEKQAEQIIGLGPNATKQVPYIIGLDLDTNVMGVTVKNLNIKSFSIGAYIRTTENRLEGNAVTDNIVGVLLSGSGNTIKRNYIANNKQGLFFGFEQTDGSIGNIPSDIIISQNSFINNTRQLSGCVCKEYNLSETRHSWDNGKEGNFWSDYNGTDANHDGIGDSPYIVDVLNMDRYPLVVSVASPPTIMSQLPVEIAVLAIAVPIIVLLAVVALRKTRKKA
jgi:parallel beta-helix repeat protein